MVLNTILLFGSIILAIITTFAFLFLVMKTPAGVWLKAILFNKKILRLRDKNGIGYFEAVKDDKEFLDSSRGPVAKTENSSFLEDKSKIPVFESFAEFGYTEGEHYAAILQELRELGINIKKFGQYEKLLSMMRKDEDRKKLVEKLIKKYPEKEKEIKDTIKKEGITIKEYKTYNYSALSDMYPFNIHPGYIETKIDNEVERRMKMKGGDVIKWVGIGITVMIIIIGFVIAYKALGGNAPTEVVCRVAETGVQVAKNNTLQSING